VNKIAVKKEMFMGGCGRGGRWGRGGEGGYPSLYLKAIFSLAISWKKSYFCRKLCILRKKRLMYYPYYKIFRQNVAVVC